MRRRASKRKIKESPPSDGRLPTNPRTELDEKLAKGVEVVSYTGMNI